MDEIETDPARHKRNANAMIGFDFRIFNEFGLSSNVA